MTNPATKTPKPRNWTAAEILERRPLIERIIREKRTANLQSLTELNATALRGFIAASAPAFGVVPRWDDMNSDEQRALAVSDPDIFKASVREFESRTGESLGGSVR